MLNDPTIVLPNSLRCVRRTTLAAAIFGVEREGLRSSDETHADESNSRRGLLLELWRRLSS
jgi:hypothetical protein